MSITKEKASINRNMATSESSEDEQEAIDESEEFIYRRKHEQVSKDLIEEGSLGQFGAESENRSSVENQIGVTKKRWLILFLFSLITLANGAIWITIPSISNIVMEYYKVQYFIVNWFSMSFLLSYAIFAMPASTFLEKFGVKACILTAASLNGIGASLRYAGVERKRFIFVASGQIFAAVGSAFVLQVPPKLAAVWFGEHERATATSIGVLMNIFGVALGFIQPTSIVKDSTDMNEVRNGMQTLLSSQAWFCMASLILAYIFIDEKPKIPPSRSEALRDERSGVFEHFSVAKSLKMLFTNRNFNLTAQAYGIMFGLLTAMSTLLNQTLKLKYPSVSDLRIGMMGFVATILGTGATFFVGLIIDRYQRYKIIAVFLFTASVFSMTGLFILLLYFQNFVVLFVIFCILNTAMVPFLSSGLEQLAEITYPVSEDLSSTVPLILGNFYGFVFVYAFGWLVDKNLLQIAYPIMISICALGLVLVMVAKVPMNRSKAEH